MQDRYIFPALFGHDVPGQVGVAFPDIPGCTSQSDDDISALHDAREALALHLWSMEKDGDEIPAPSPLTALRPRADEVVVLVDVFMPLFRESMETRAVNRTVTLPRWLDVAGREEGVNFSQVLQDALMERLGIHRAIDRRRGRKRKGAPTS